MSSEKTLLSGLSLVVLLVLVTGCAQQIDEFVIQRSDSLPATTPWDLETLSKPPAFEWGEGTEVRSLYYEGEPLQGNPTRVFAYYATPGTLKGDASLDKDLPAIVLVHGGGGAAFPSWVKLWAERGYAAIAMDLAGQGVDRERLDNGGPDQKHSDKFGGIDLPITDQWPYHAVADVILAHSLVRSFPEVNPDKTALTGISWGGYLTCIVAGLDNRFKAAVPIYGCGFIHENSAWVGKFEAMSSENREAWIQYWEPSQYVGSTTVPMFFVNGGTDFAFPPDSHTKTYDLVRSEKNIRFVATMRHSHIFDRPPEVQAFIEHHLRNGKPLHKITHVEVLENSIVAHVEGPFEVTKAKLYYSLEGPQSDPKQREWHSVPAALENGLILSETPPGDAQMWFLTARDDRGFIVSSGVHFKI